MVYGLLCIIILALCVKIYLMKKSAREISEQFADRLQTDTNTLIDISSHDKDMMHLASSINEQLRILRKEHLQYHQGNTELKNAITNISHDLRTPLTAICGYLDMIKKTDNKEKINRYLSIITERTTLMKQLTEELFRYSVILAKESEPNHEDVFINQLLAESIGGFYSDLSKKNITPTIHITDKEIIRRTDRAALERIFSNILSNAVKYSDGDLLVTLDESGVITFENKANGISEVDVSKLFDRFYTVESAKISTGLGLSIARALAEQVGGSITAQYINGRLVITLTV